MGNKYFGVSDHRKYTNKKYHYLKQTPDEKRAYTIAGINKTLLNKEIYESSIFKVIADRGFGEKSSEVRLTGKKPWRDASVHPSAANARKLLVDFADQLKNTPNEQTGDALTKKVIQGSTKYVPQTTIGRKNLFDQKSPIEAILNGTANDFFVFDLETLGGTDEYGLQRNDFITEVSFRHYAGKAMKDIDVDNDLASDSINAFIGLSPEGAKKTRTLLADVLAGKKKNLSDLTGQQRVYVNELIKFSDIQTSKIGDYNVVTQKMSEDASQELLNTHRLNDKVITEKLEKGLKVLEDAYSPENHTKVYDKVKEAIQYVNATDNALAVSANGITFDNPVLAKELNGVKFDVGKQFDVTELAQTHSILTGNVTRGGAQLSNLIQQAGLPVGSAHAAYEDTKMTLQYAQSELSLNRASEVFDYINNNAETFDVSDIYTANTTFRASLGYIEDPTTGERIFSTGNPSIDGDINYQYDTTVNSGISYRVRNNDIIDIANLPEDQKQILADMAGDKYRGVDKLHRVTLHPIYDHKQLSKQEMLPKIANDRTLFLSDEDYSSFLSSMKHTAIVDKIEYLDENDHTVHSATGIIPDEPIKVKGSVLPETNQHNAFLKKATSVIENKSKENAYRKFNENPYEFFQMLKLSDTDSIPFDKKFAEAIASGDAEKIKSISSQWTRSASSAYSWTPEKTTHVDTYLLDIIHDMEPIARGITKSLDEDMITDDLRRSNIFNESLKTTMGAIPIDRELNDLLYDEEILPKQPIHKRVTQNQLTLTLPDIIASTSPTDAFTVNFDNPYSSFKMADTLLNKSRIDTTKMLPADIELKKQSLMEDFLKSITNERLANTDPAEANRANKLFDLAKKKGYIDSKGNITDAFRETEGNEALSDTMSRRMFSFLKDSGERTTSLQVKAPNHTIVNNVARTLNSTIKENNPDKISDIAYQITKGYTGADFFQYKDMFDFGEGGEKPSYNKNKYNDIVTKFTDTLVDPELRSKDSYVEFLRKHGFTDSDIALRTKGFESTLSGYKRMLGETMSAYSKSGISFRATDGALYASDSTSKEVLLNNMPILKASDTGIAYIQTGSQRVRIDQAYRLDPKTGAISIQGQFDNIPYNARPYNVVNHADSVTVDTVKHNLSQMIGEITESSDISHLPKSAAITSGATISVKDFGINLFGEKSYDSFGYLDEFKNKHEAEYEKLKKLYGDSAYVKYGNVPDSLANMGSEFYDEFLSNEHRILSSIAVKAGETDKDLANIILNTTLSETGEKVIQNDFRQLGRFAPSPSSNFYVKARPTGMQTEKPMHMRKDQLKKYKINNTGRVINSSKSKALDTTESAYGIEGLDIIDSFRVNAVHMSEGEYLETLNKMSQDAELRKSVEKKFGNNSFDTIMKHLVIANVDNDGSIVSDRLAKATPADIMNSTTKELEKYSVLSIENADKTVSAFDCIPEIEIDPETNAIKVTYEDDFFVKSGSSLMFMNKDAKLADANLSQNKVIKYNSIGRVAFVGEDGIRLTEEEVSKLANELPNAQRVLGSEVENIDKVFALSRELKKKHGVSANFIVESANEHFKFGMGEEKSFTTPLSLAIDALETNKAILQKYGFYESEFASLSGTTVRDEMLDLIGKDLNIPKSKLNALRRGIASPTTVMKEVLGVSNLDVITDLNAQKHKSQMQTISSRVSQIMEHMSPNLKDGFLQKVFNDPTAHYDSEAKQVIGDNIGEAPINTAAIEEQYSKYKGLGKLTTKYGDTYDVSTEVLNKLNDEEGKKYSGQAYSAKLLAKQQLANGEIGLDEAIEKHKIIDKHSITDGAIMKQANIDKLRQQYITEDSLAPILHGDPNDSVIGRQQEYLINQRIAKRNEESGDLELTPEYEKGTRSIYGGTLDSMADTIRYGDDSELKLGDYASASQVPHGYEDIYEKYAGDKKYHNYSLQKLSDRDLLDEYASSIKPFNDANLSKVKEEDKANFVSRADMVSNNQYAGLTDNVVAAKDLRVTSGTNAETVLRGNNPYTNNTVVDLGEDFGDDRYLAVQGRKARYYDGRLIKEEYQQQLTTLRNQSADYDDFVNDRLTPARQEELFGVKYADIDNEEKRETLQNRIKGTADKIKYEQESSVTGKKSVATRMSSLSSPISARLETQTLNVVPDKLTGLAEYSGLDDKYFEGMPLREHMQNGRLIDGAIISRKTAEGMGLYNEEVASSVVSGFKEQFPEEYERIANSLPDPSQATNIDIADSIYTKHGFNASLSRDPVIFSHSETAARVWVDDAAGDEAIRVFRHTQALMKNDNDGDKTAIKALSREYLTDQNASLAITAQSYRNYRGQAVTKMSDNASKQYNPSSLVQSRSMFGDLYSGISSVEELVDIENRINDAAPEVAQTYTDLSSRAAQVKSDDMSATYHQLATAKARLMYADPEEQTKYVAGLDQMYIDQTRYDDYIKATNALGSKGKIGSVNNNINLLTSVANDYSSKALEMMDVNDPDRDRYLATRQFFSEMNGNMIENTINAKNTSSAESSGYVHRTIDDISNLLFSYDTTKRKQAATDFSEILNNTIGGKIDDYVTSNIGDWKNDSILRFMQNKVGNEIDFTTATNDAELMTKRRKSIIDNMIGTIQETDVKANQTYKNAIGIGASNRSATKEALDAFDGVRTKNVYQGISGTMGGREFRNRVKDAGADAFSNTIPKTSRKATTNIVRDVIKSSTSRNIALGALGLAATIMVAGFVGGNPSKAPQNDANEMASYKNDNYNYEDRMVMPPPPTNPQGPQNGYVINMRASTNGSHYQASGQAVQAAQRSYAPTMNVNVKQNFSYSANMSNDRYIESILNDLM